MAGNVQVERFFVYAQSHTSQFPPTMSDVIVAEFGKDPFILLMSCLISLRAKDRVTTPICLELFRVASTPGKLLEIPKTELEKRLFSVGFYRAKAQTLQSVSQELLDRFGGVVPWSIEELLSLPGVGRKTANLVVGMAFDEPAICVDVHVHRIANRFGWVQTVTSEETEIALQKIIPKELWIECNRQLVLIGQNGCLSAKGCGRKCEIAIRGFEIF
jgi:endonuclease-3